MCRRLVPAGDVYASTSACLPALLPVSAVPPLNLPTPPCLAALCAHTHMSAAPLHPDGATPEHSRESGVHGRSDVSSPAQPSSAQHSTASSGSLCPGAGTAGAGAKRFQGTLLLLPASHFSLFLRTWPCEPAWPSPNTAGLRRLTCRGCTLGCRRCWLSTPAGRRSSKMR